MKGKNLSLGKTVSEDEVEKFSKLADSWWDEDGNFAMLHKINPVRLEYLVRNIKKHFLVDEKADLSQLEIIDIGCGGGLIAEPLARLNASVTAIDASEKNIKAASLHAEKSNLKINYLASSIEELVDLGHHDKYDVVLAMEVIEHVADINLFLESCAKLLKKNGLLFVATLNRTTKSYLFAILGAEYILRWLPIGTHDWEKFIKPSELENMLSSYHLSLQSMSGMVYNIKSRDWKMDDKDVAVNYIAIYKKY